MKVARVVAGVLMFVSPAFAQEAPPPAAQIAGAVLAAPEDKRAGAKVLGWDGGAKMVTLREGTNELICLADNPKIDGFNVACYHKDLDPFMARGRELTAAAPQPPDTPTPSARPRPMPHRQDLPEPCPTLPFGPDRRRSRGRPRSSDPSWP